MATSAPPRLVVAWLRNDLRLHDSAVLTAAATAAAAGKGGGAARPAAVLPLVCLDPRQFGPSRLLAIPKTGAFRARFLLETLADLRQRLVTIHSDLLVAVGRPGDVLRQITGALTREEAANLVVFAQAEVASEERSQEREVAAALPRGAAQLQLLRGSTLYAHTDMVELFGPHMGKLPDTFTPFRKRVEGHCAVPPPLPPPAAGALGRMADPLRAQLAAGGLEVGRLPAWEELPWVEGGASPPSPPEPCAKAAMEFAGGETAALARLEHYVFGEGHAVATYFETRNSMLGADGSTKFSPWLALGALSPRQVHARIADFERQSGQANKSTYWVSFELLWRDFFRLIGIKHGTAIFHEQGLLPRPPTWAGGLDEYERWAQGRTGWPLVDANMREMLASGFMSNRGRQNVASFLVHDLGVDWRLGAELFESLLIDYDVTSNWGNWMYVAGLSGGRVNRFNIVKQSRDYDAGGAYVRHWLPELARVPDTLVHQPWVMTPAQQAAAQCKLGSDYPERLPSLPFHASPGDRGRAERGSSRTERFSSRGGGGGGHGGGAARSANPHRKQGSRQRRHSRLQHDH